MQTHILVVNDDPLESKLMTFLLNEAGYTVKVIADPRAVEATLQQQTADLLLMDTSLPYVNGFALCGQLKRPHSDPPIILLPGHATTEDLVKGFSQGADDFIKRPYDPAVLLARIQAVLRRYRRQERHADGVLV